MPELEFRDLEAFYERLAEAIDEAGKAREGKFLAKLALLLARLGGDPEKALAAIETALRDLG